MPSNLNALRDNNPFLIVKEIQDVYLRQNFQKLRDYFNQENQLFGFKYFEVTFSAAENNRLIDHGLLTIPQDAIVTQVVGEGSVTFNWGLFSTSQMNLSASGPCRICFFLGTYWNKQSPQVAGQTETQTFQSSVASSVLSGEIKTWPGRVVPSGYLPCDGQLYDAKTYPALAAVLWDSITNGYAYGGEGYFPGGKFNVPDLRGVFLRGWSNDSDRDPARSERTTLNQGGNTGNNIGSFQEDLTERHYHEVWWKNNWTFGTGSTSGAYSMNNFGLGSRQIPGPSAEGPPDQTDTRLGDETRPKNVYVQYIIKT